MPRVKKDAIVTLETIPVQQVTPAPLTPPTAPARARKTASTPVATYPMPVDEPLAPLKESQVSRTPTKRTRISLPDPFAELPERTRSYLRLMPYGDNIIINKKLASGLLEFIQKIRELPLPDTVWKELMAHQERLRTFLGYISLAEFEEPWKTMLKEDWTPFYPQYECKCAKRKRRNGKTKELQSTTEDDE